MGNETKQHFVQVESYLAAIDKNVDRIVNPRQKKFMARLVVSGVTIGAGIVGIVTFILQLLHML
jgi:preprotein translocase subunit Sss1